MKKLLKTFISIVLSLVTTFGIYASPVFAEETSTDAGTPVALAASTQIRAAEKTIASSGTLTVYVEHSHFNVNVVAGTYDSNGTGSVECYIVRPSGGTTYMGSFDAKNDHIEYYLTFCPKGEYKFIFEASNSSRKTCYVRMYNI